MTFFSKKTSLTESNIWSWSSKKYLNLVWSATS